MDCENKSVDLEGDEELEALRKAALASLKSRAAKKSEAESSLVGNISKVSTLITPKTSDQPTYLQDNKDQAKGSAYGNHHSWRNTSQSSRRGRGRQFPKPNQRSNLIVITPVNTTDQKSDDKGPLPQLVLPQHKWCQSATEDSSSPKTYRRTGPTRFNRHGSGSDSSDSDYDNSDNDSYSNETILQDELSNTFTRLAPEEKTVDNSVPEKSRTSDRRLSFQNLDSSLTQDDFQQKETENVFNSSKSSYSNCSKEEKKASRSVPREIDSVIKKEYSQCNSAPGASVSNEYAVFARDRSPVHSEKGQTASSSMNGGSHMVEDYLLLTRAVKDAVKPSRSNPEKPLENDSHNGSPVTTIKSHISNLSEGDLRFELKKRNQELKSKKTNPSKTQNEILDDHTNEQNRDDNRQVRSLSQERQEGRCHARKHRYREHYHSRSNRSRSRSSSPINHGRSTSPSRGHLDQNRKQIHDRTDRHGKRKRSVSSDRSHKRSQRLDQRSATQNRRHRNYSGTSSSSTSSSTSSSSSSVSPPIRSISSVVKSVARTVDSKPRDNINSLDKHPTSLGELDSVTTSKRRDLDEKSKLTSSPSKPSTYGDSRNIAPDGVKRVPVHMRLGTLPRKRVIQMAKDVEAAFVNTSSDDENDVNMRCKKQNFRVVTEIYGDRVDEVSKRHVAKRPCRNVDVLGDKARRVKVER